MARRRTLVLGEEHGWKPFAACPWCGAALSSLERGQLRPIVHNLFRCPPGQHPCAFEARCGGCARLLVVVKTEAGLELVSGDQDDLLRSVRELDREAMAIRDRGGRDEASHKTRKSS